jgi:hypothetical protein
MAAASTTSALSRLKIRIAAVASGGGEEGVTAAGFRVREGEEGRGGASGGGQVVGSGSEEEATSVLYERTSGGGQVVGSRSEEEATSVLYERTEGRKGEVWYGGAELGFRAFYRTMTRSGPLNQKWMVRMRWSIWADMGLFAYRFSFSFFAFI